MQQPQAQPRIFSVSGISSSLLFPREGVAANRLGPPPGTRKLPGAGISKLPGKGASKGGKGKSRRNKKGRKTRRVRHR